MGTGSHQEADDYAFGNFKLWLKVEGALSWLETEHC